MKEYLLKFYEDLKPKESNEQRGRKAGTYKWYEIQDNVAYYKDFEKDKITWLELTDIPKFAFDSERFFIEATAFVMTGQKLKYLVAFLNSKVCEWYFDKITTTSGVGTNRWKKVYLQNLPVPEITTDQENNFNNLIDKILDNKRNGVPIDDLEHTINIEVYKLYNFSPIEIQVFK